MISNLLVIPFAGITMVVGICALLLLALGIAAKWLFAIIEYLVHFLLNALKYISELPGSLLENIHINTTQALLLLAALYALIWAIENKSSLSLWLSIIFILMIQIQSIFQTFELVNSQFVQYYKVKTGVLIDIFDHGHVYTVKSQSVSSKTEDFISNGLRRKHGIQKESHQTVQPNYFSVSSSKFKIYFSKEKLIYSPTSYLDSDQTSKEYDPGLPIELAY